MIEHIPSKDARLIERMRQALLAWYEASDDEERKWAMELTAPLKDSLRKPITPETDELRRLRQIENMALRVASGRRDGIVTDRTALDNLDAALEASERRPVDWEAEYKKLAGVYTREGLEKFIADYWPGNVLADATTLKASDPPKVGGYTCHKCEVWYAGPNGLHDCPAQKENV